MAKSISQPVTYKYKNKAIDNLGFCISLILISVIILSISSLLFFGFGNKDNYLSTGDIFGILRFTFLQSLLSVFLSAYLGIYVAQILVSIQSQRFKSYFLSLSSVAFVIPTVVAGIGIIKVWGGNGLISYFEFILGSDQNFINFYGLLGILLAHIFFNAPLFVRVFYSCFGAIPDNYLKNADQLNIKGFNYFLLLEWPSIRHIFPLLFGVVFLQCFSSFSLILMLGGGPSSSTLEVAIYTAVRYDFDLNSAAILAFIQLAICLIVLIVLDFFQNSKISHIQIKTTYTYKRWVQNKSFRKIFSNIFGMILYSLLIFLPLLMLIISGLNFEIINILSNAKIYFIFFYSITISLISTFITVVISWFIAEARTNIIIQNELDYVQFFKLKFYNISILLYLAVPAIVLGTGLFVLFKGFLSYSYFPFLILIFSNVMLCLPFSVNIIQSKSIYLRKKHDRLCSLLGISGLNRFLTIDFPSIRSVLGFSAGISACLSLGDLSVITLFGSQDFQTIPWLIFQYLSSYRIKEAACVSLLLIIMCFSLFYFFSRILGGENA